MNRIPVGYAFRLPTEADWDYACRAGTTTRFSYGDDPDYTQFINYAWFNQNSNGLTQPVGQKSSNPWGLYDMHGNVNEWCLHYPFGYTGGSVIDPIGPDTSDPRMGRAIRGGYWYSHPSGCRSAGRYDGVVSFTIGFRVVLAPARP